MDIGQILSTVAPVVENIFIYLNRRELDSCSKVCELWRRVAETERKRREDITWFFQGGECVVHHRIHASSRECSYEEDVNSVENDLSAQLKNLTIKPEFCLVFATNYFIRHFKQLFPSFEYPPSSLIKKFKHDDVVYKKAYLRAALHSAIGQFLPSKCQTTFFVAQGIVGSLSDVISLEIEDGCGISGIMIPHVPGLKIFSFTIDERNNDISKLVPSDTDIKCLLVFHSSNETSSFHKIVQSCLLRERSQVAIGGALIERSLLGRSSVIAFCGRSVEAASIIIKPKDKEMEVEKKLKSFEETGLLQDRCFAFMFACVARGYFVYGRYNVESSIFHKLYPNVPLIGVFGNGEIGVHYLPSIESVNQNEVLRIGKLVRSRKKFLHSYTTIFVLISIKL